jgi:hypothetical protein
MSFGRAGTPLSLLLSWLCEVLEKPDLKYMRVPRLDCQRRPVRGSELVEPHGFEAALAALIDPGPAAA